MCESPSSSAGGRRRQHGGVHDDKHLLELNKDLERMIEDVENISVQLTWMAYDMVVWRTGPEQAALRSGLQDAYRKCRAVVCRQDGGAEPNAEPQEEDTCAAEPAEKPPANPRLGAT